MAEANTAKDKSFEDQTPKQNVTPKGDDKKTTEPAKVTEPAKTDKKPEEVKEPKVDTKPAKADSKKDSEKKPNKPTETVDKSFKDDKKKVNKSIKVGDRVAYPFLEGEHGKRTSKVYAVDEDTVTVLGYDGQKVTVGKDRVEVV